MSINDFLNFLAQILFVALSAVAIFAYLRRPNPRRRDFVLLCSSLGIPLGGTLLKDLFGIQSGLLDIVGALALFTQPYFLFRLLQYYRPGRRWVHWAILTGMVLCWVVLILYIATYPATTQVIIFGYCVIVDAYCTWEYGRGMLNTVGILRRRLLFITISSGLFTLAVAGNVLNALLPSLAQNIGAVGLAVTAVSAILYYVAFIPPRWLRHAWQFEELRDSLTVANSTVNKDASIAECFQQLSLAANQAVNGVLGTVVQWDEESDAWTILGSTDPTFTSDTLLNGQRVLEKVWQQRQPISVYVPDMQEMDERRQMELVGARTWLLVPIHASQSLWGVLVVLLRDRALFIDDDLTLLELLAQQSAIVLDNKHLIGELQGYSGQLERKVEERTAELSESEERFRYLADSAPVMIWLTDLDGRSVYFNQQWYDFIGSSSTNGMERNWFNAIIHPEDAQNTNQTFTERHQQRRPFRQEYRLRRHDGTYRWLIDSAIPRVDQTGKFIGYIGSILDITERKEAEERLRVLHQLSEAVNRAEAVEQIYELALSSLERVLGTQRAAILLFDQKGALHIQAWHGLSAKYRAATDGQLPQVINERDPQTILFPNVAEAYLGLQQQAMLDEGIHAVGFIPLVEQKRLLGKFMLYYDQPHSFSDAEVQWAQTIARYVAYALQRKQSEAKLQTYTRTVEELNHIQLSLAAELDIQKLLQMVTDVSTALSGAEFGAFFYPVQESVQEKGEEEKGEEENRKEENEEASMLFALSGVPHEAFAQVSLLHPDDLFCPTFNGEKIVQLAGVTQDALGDQNTNGDNQPLALFPHINSYLAIPVVSRVNEVIGGLFFGHSKPDVFTEQTEQLMGSLASQVAITIENARLYVQIKESEADLLDLNTTLEERVKTRTAELERSNGELDQFAYIASHDLKAPLRAMMHLTTWIQQDAGEFLPPTSKGHLEKLQGRVRRMETLLNDLLAYSRVGRQHHATELVDISALIHSVTELTAPPAGFTVKIAGELPVMQVERTPLETVFRNLIGNAIKHHENASEGTVEISAQEQKHFVEFIVKDDGPGIAPEFHQRIFEIFQTLQPRDKVEASGIGLAIVKKSIESRGGTIRVESTLGEGTTFCFTWPKLVPSK